MEFDQHIYGSDIYKTWLECANERDLLKDLLEAQRHRWLTHNPTRLLEIGCGSGAAGLRMMEIAESAGVRLEYTGIDPYQNQLNDFATALGMRKADLRVGSIESFASAEKWDVVITVHSLYYVDDLLEALRKLGSLGRQLILVHHGERGINEVHVAFCELVQPGPHVISTYHDVARALAKLGWEYELQTFESSVDVSACADSFNFAGRNLIRFFLERSDLDEATFKPVAEWFGQRPARMVHDVGLLFAHPKS